MTASGPVRCALPLLLAAVLAAPRSARAAVPSWLDVSVESGLGVDSNAYLAPVYTDSAHAEPYWFLRSGLGGQARLGPHFRVDGDWDFDGRFFGDALLQETRHRLRLDQRWRPGPTGRMSWTVRQEVVWNDDTFSGRGDREEFETSSGGQLVSLGDRFDYRDLEASGEAEVRVAGAFSLLAESSVRRRDYRFDFETHPDLYSLDQWRWEGRGGLALSGRPGKLALTAGARRVDYDEKFSRDSKGDEVSVVPVSYLDRDGALELARPSRRGADYLLRARVRHRADRFVGYWDRLIVSLSGALGWTAKRGHRVALSIFLSDSRYRTARVSFDPEAEIRDKAYHRVSLLGSYRVGALSRAVARVRWVDRVNNSPRFHARQMEVELGMQTRL